MKKNSKTSSQWPVRKVSLQLKHSRNQQLSLSHQRVSLNYSQNFKKKTAALITKNKAINDLLQKQPTPAYNKITKSYSRDSKQDTTKCKGNTSILFGSKCQKVIPSTRSKALEVAGQNNLQRIRISPEQNKIFVNYQTVTSKIIQDAINPQPNYQSPISYKKRPLSSQYAGRTRTQLLYAKKQRQYGKMRKQEEQPKSNRIISQPIANKEGMTMNNNKVKDGKQKYKKQILKTSEINLSNHFTKMGNNFLAGSPLCKKMTVSNINRYYELCIKDLKSMKETKMQKDQKRNKQMKTQPILDTKQLIKSQYIPNQMHKNLRYTGFMTSTMGKKQFWQQQPDQTDNQCGQICLKSNQSSKKLKTKPPLPQFRHSLPKEQFNYQDFQTLEIGAWEDFTHETQRLEELT